jgi:hypothetical protein
MLKTINAIKGRLMTGAALLIVSAVLTTASARPAGDGGPYCSECILVGWWWICGPCL